MNTPYNKCCDSRDNVQRKFMKNWNVRVLDKSLYAFFSVITERIFSSPKYTINIPNTI